MVKLTVEEARSKNLCRICGEPTDVAPPGDQPKDAKKIFGELLYVNTPGFRPVTYNFGKEYAHTDCLAKEVAGAQSGFEIRVIKVTEEIVYDMEAATEAEAVKNIRRSLGVVDWSRLEVAPVKVKDQLVVRKSETKKYKRGPSGSRHDIVPEK